MVTPPGGTLLNARPWPHHLILTTLCGDWSHFIDKETEEGSKDGRLAPRPALSRAMLSVPQGGRTRSLLRPAPGTRHPGALSKWLLGPRMTTVASFRLGGGGECAMGERQGVGAAGPSLAPRPHSCQAYLSEEGPVEGNSVEAVNCAHVHIQVH